MDVEQRLDSWQNLLTGLGGVKDKATHTHFSVDNHILPSELLESLYANDDIAARICELLPQEMLRQGFEIVIDGDSETSDAINNELKSLNFCQKLTEALIWSRVFGGSALFMGVDDSQDPSMKLNMTAVRKLRFVSILNSPDLWPKTQFKDPLESNYGETETYSVLSASAGYDLSPEIHESRLLVFHGTRTTRRMRKHNRGWSLSVLQRLYPILKQFNLTWQAATHMMADASLSVFKLKGLHQSIASNSIEDISRRIELLSMSKSVANAIVVDADSEDFSLHSQTFSGVPDMLEKSALRVASAAPMPVSLLMGQAPAGMNATGDSDIRFFYDQIRSGQEQLKPSIERFVKILMAAKEGPTDGEILPFSIEFPSLWQMTEKEKAELAQVQADTDCKYIQEGVLLPEEVALQRFGSEVAVNATMRTNILNDDKGGESDEMDT